MGHPDPDEGDGIRIIEDDNVTESVNPSKDGWTWWADSWEKEGPTLTATEQRRLDAVLYETVATSSSTTASEGSAWGENGGGKKGNNMANGGGGKKGNGKKGRHNRNNKRMRKNHFQQLQKKGDDETRRKKAKEAGSDKPHYQCKSSAEELLTNSKKKGFKAVFLNPVGTLTSANVIKEMFQREGLETHGVLLPKDGYYFKFTSFL